MPSDAAGFSTPYPLTAMSDLNTAFEAAVAQSKTLSERPDNATLLKLYALYKQGTVGDNGEKKPGFGDMVGRAKWDAWNHLKGTSPEVAQQQYIDLVDSLS
jgi:diazepam-binding inhibitor (GABA receptor modulator, acyl-CoA-binding protein)